jgi:DNA modification methylase
MSGAWQNRIVGEGMESPEQILANPMNWRVHPQAQRKALRGALQEVGWVQRVIVNRRTGHLIDGHLRVDLALEDGAAEIPVVYVDLSEAEERVALASVDSITALAETDQALLDQLVNGAQVEDQDLEAFLASLASVQEEETEGETDPDACPEPQPDPHSRTGDLWLLGDHRVLCGDSTRTVDVARLCDGQAVQMIWTDPPYNVDYEGSDGKKIQNDHMGDAQFRQFLLDAFSAAFLHLVEGGPIYIAHADSEGYNFRGAMVEAGFLLKQTLIWVKNSMVLGRQDYQWQHEPILYGWKPGAAHRWFGDFNKKTVIDDAPDLKAMDKGELLNEARRLRNALNTTVIREDKPKRNGDHPTMKPVALITHMLKNSSARGDQVLDPFGGSGSTLIAAQRLGRHARLMEMDPVYCDVIVQRWQDFTGQTAYHADTGQPFKKANA